MRALPHLVRAQALLAGQLAVQQRHQRLKPQRLAGVGQEGFVRDGARAAQAVAHPVVSGAQLGFHLGRGLGPELLPGAGGDPQRRRDHRRLHTHGAEIALQLQ
jgi:hypothetical protein